MRSLRLLTSSVAAVAVVAVGLSLGAAGATAAEPSAVSVATPFFAVDAATATSAGATLTIAHRGSSAVAPENTLAAFALGVNQGADLIETDVQRSKDGGLVLIHDPTLDRTTDVEQKFPKRSPWRVRDFTLAEIRTLDAGSWKASRYAGQRVPTLLDLVRLVRYTRSGILLELKSPELYPGIEAQVAATWLKVPGYLRTATRAHRLVVQSFDIASIRRHKALRPQVPVGLLGTPAMADLPALATWADQVNPAHASIDAAYVEQAHRVGLQVLTWTVDSEAAMGVALDRGVDGVITNRPDRLEALLTRRATVALRPAA